jgi:uncharacterized ferritin-like protein (DUF455 family)
MATTDGVRGFCLRILEAGDLDSKLAPPPRNLASETGVEPPVHIDHPQRDLGLHMRGGSPRLPRPGELRDPEARIHCLARFAHHELMAVELFAWALLRWPDLPPALRSGFLHVLAEEQTHCRLYAERVESLGSHLHEHPHSDYFWKHAPAIAASPHGARAFLCAMGLTLEQANLDFTGLYRDAFRNAGDEASAHICQRVLDDEVAHVALAARWMRRLRPGCDDVEAYTEAVPFPLSAARAKGKRFDVPARRRAGLSPDFIDHVRRARSTQELAGERHRPLDR